jgi:hypothetical protein
VRKIPRAVYLTADELDEVVAVRAAEVDALSNDAAKHALLKRWLSFACTQRQSDGPSRPGRSLKGWGCASAAAIKQRRSH